MIKRELITAVIAIAVFFGSGFVFIGVLQIYISSEAILMMAGHGLAVAVTAMAIWVLHKNYVMLHLPIDMSNMSYVGVTIGVIGVFVLSTAVIVAASALASFVDYEALAEGNVDVSDEVMTKMEIVAYIISSGIFAPLIEEVIFRGILYGALRKIMKVRYAVILSSLCFGLVHGISLMVILGAAATGMVLAVIYEKYDNLFNCMMIHGIYNSATILAAFA